MGYGALGSLPLLVPTHEAEAAPAGGTAPYNGRFYGCMVGADYHTNTFLKGSRTVSLRFLAEETGSIASFHWQARHDGPNPKEFHNGRHSFGMGGLLTISLRTDAGDGKPDLSTAGLITKTRVNNGSPIALALREPNVTWSFIEPGVVKKGQLYHLVITNSHPTDYISVNTNYYRQPIPASHPSGRHGPYYRNDWGHLYRTSGGSWVDRGGLPYVTLNYTNGIKTGSAEDLQDIGSVRPISGAKRTRQTFVVTDRSYTFDALWFRVWSSNGVGELVVRLQNASGATLFEKALAASSFPKGEQRKIVVPWTRVAVGSPITLKKGAGYHLEFSSPKGAFNITAIRDGGVLHGFLSRNRWLNSLAQTSDNGGVSWTGWTIPKFSPNGRKDMMLPAGFELV